MIPLLRKDFYLLRWVLMVTLLLHWMAPIISFFFERVDESTWLTMLSSLAVGGEDGSVYMLFLLSFFSAGALFGREFDEGSMAFIYTLPVSRQQVYWSKIIVLTTILIGGNISGVYLSGWVSLLNPDSLGGNHFNTSLAAKYSLLSSAFILLILSHGVFFSYLRRFGLVVYLLLYQATKVLEKWSPDTAILSPAELLRLEYFGQELLIPIPLLAGHLLFAGGFCGSALFFGHLLRSESADGFFD